MTTTSEAWLPATSSRSCASIPRSHFDSAESACVNTSMLSDFERDNYLSGMQADLALPCVDPIATGMTPIANFMLQVAGED